jgi:hypothetical protein
MSSACVVHVTLAQHFLRSVEILDQYFGKQTVFTRMVAAERLPETCQSVTPKGNKLRTKVQWNRLTT